MARDVDVDIQQDENYQYSNYASVAAIDNTIIISPVAGSANITTINGGGGGSVTGPTVTLSGGTTGLTFIGAGTTLTMSGVLAVANGGVPQTAWAAYVPTWTNLTVGNGTVTAKYLQIGKYVAVRLSIVFGTTTSVSGTIQFSLPTASVAYPVTATTYPLGNAVYYDSGATVFSGLVLWASTTKAQFDAGDVTGTYAAMVVVNATVPFTWGTSDELQCEFFYESA